MPKPKKARHLALVDLGPDVRRQRGDILAGFRPDPDNPSRNLYGASRRIWYRVAWLEGFLSHAQHEAADRYLLRLEQHQGAQEGSAATAAGVRGNGGGGPTERQVMATAELRAADAVLGAEAALARAVIGWNITPAPEQAALLRAALERLAKHWGIS